MNNPHVDILDAEIPPAGEKRDRLLEELKTRAKGVFQARDLYHAEKLYTKAIDVDKNDHLLYSNRAAVRLLRKEYEGALRDTGRCLDINPTFVKAHYRKAQALWRLDKFKDAIDACKAGIEQNSGNATAELSKLQGEIQTAWEQDIEEKKNFKDESQKVKPDMPKPQPTRLILTPEEEEKRKKEKEEREKKVEADKDAKLRGYKKTADGKTTSYFHTELSEEAKKLIGDCKPQKIEETNASDTNSASIGSAWNQAGTFESRTYTKWYEEKLRAAIESENGDDCPGETILDLPNDLPSLRVTFSAMGGDASINCARGKVKHLHAVSLTVKWKFLKNNGSESKGSGKSTFEADLDGDFDVTHDIDSSTSNALKPVVAQFIKNSSAGLQPFVTKCMTRVSDEFKGIKP